MLTPGVLVSAVRRQRCLAGWFLRWLHCPLYLPLRQETSASAPARIQISELQNGAKSGVELKDWGIQSAAWAPDNQHIYVSGSFDNKFQIASVSLDGRVKNLISTPVGPGMDQ